MKAHVQFPIPDAFREAALVSLRQRCGVPHVGKFAGSLLTETVRTAIGACEDDLQRSWVSTAGLSQLPSLGYTAVAYKALRKMAVPPGCPASEYLAAYPDLQEISTCWW